MTDQTDLARRGLDALLLAVVAKHGIDEAETLIAAAQLHLQTPVPDDASSASTASSAFRFGAHKLAATLLTPAPAHPRPSDPKPKAKP
jgi:hypothetical protein